MDQAEKIKKFVPEPYWSIEAVVSEKLKAYSLKWGRGKIFEKTVVSILHSRISAINVATVLSVEKSQKIKPKP